MPVRGRWVRNQLGREEARLGLLVALCLLLAPVAAAAAGPTIDVWYGQNQSMGQNGIGQRWINVLGNVSDPDGVVSLTWSLNGGAAHNLSLGPDTRRLLEPGDFNAEIDAALFVDGPNTVELVARDSLSETSSVVVDIDFSADTPGPRSRTVDWDAPGAVTINDVAQAVDGEWDLVPGGVRPAVMGYDRTFTVGDGTFTDYELTVPITVHDVDPNGFMFPSVAPGFGITHRWLGHTYLSPPEQPHVYWLPSGGTIWYTYEFDQLQIGSETFFNSDPSTTITEEVTYIWKFRVETLANGDSFYGAKVWEEGTTEPGGWMLTGTEGVEDIKHGAPILVAHHVDCTFGDIQITEITNPGADPVITSVDVQPGGDRAVIRFVTNKPATATLDYGTTTSYGSSLVGSGPTTVHRFELTGLTPNTVHHFQISADDGVNVAVSPDDTFDSDEPIESDDFSAPSLDPRWTFVNPLGDATASVNGTELELAVPGTAGHAAGGGSNNLARILQTAPDADFEIEAEFASAVQTNQQRQGLAIEEDAQNGIHVGFQYVGGQTQLGAYSLSGGTSTVELLQNVPLGTPMYLRVRREGDDWIVFTSDDGADWVERGAFIHALNVQQVGLFAGNSNGAAHTAVVDYFFNTAAPDPLEDNGEFRIDVTVAGNGSVTLTPDQPTYELNDMVALEAFPANQDWEFVDWTGDVVSAANPVMVTVTSDLDVTASFNQFQDTIPPVVSGVGVSSTTSSATVTWSSDEAGSSRVDYGPTASYGSSVDLGGSTTSHSVPLTGLSSDTEYHFQAITEDAASNAGASPDLVFRTRRPEQTTAPYSDDFSGSGIDLSLWQFINPLGDASASLNGTQLVLDVPGNAEFHGIWIGTDTLPRLMQPAPDSDFEIEAKFESDLTTGDQIQGLLIEQDPSNVIRVEFHNVGGSTRVFAASIFGGSADIHLLQGLSLTAPMYLRVTRVGDDFTVSYSFDGSSFTPAVTFNQPMTVTRVGVQAGNSPGVPFTALVDYFFNTAEPDPVEDGGAFTLDVQTSGMGSVDVSPDKPTYSQNEMVTLEAFPANVDWQFDGWTGDVTSLDNPLVVSMTANTSLTANFSQFQDTMPPVISDLQTTVTETSATISWTTDEPVPSVVNYGLTSSYSQTESDPTPKTSHSVDLLGLQTGVEYHFEVVATDPGLNTTTTGDVTFRTLRSGAVGPPWSDDFSGTGLDSAIWTFVDPVDDASYAMTGTQLALTVPDNGFNHGIWTNGNFAPRVMQDIPDGDFEVEVKFESPVDTSEQIQGLLVEQDPNNVVRVEVHYLGSEMRIFAATIFGSTADIKLLQTLTLPAPHWLQLERSGDLFTFRYSTDGTNFTDAVSFSQPMTANRVGIFVGNDPNAGHTGVADYFFNTADPIVPEDGGMYSVTTNVSGSGQVAKTPDQPTYQFNDVVQLDATPDPGWQFDAWSGDVSSTDNPLVLAVTGDLNLTANFSQPADTTPPQISDVQVSTTESTATITWTTDEPADSLVNYGLTAGYGSSDADASLVTQHYAVLTGLSSSTEYHFEVVSADASLNSASSGDLSFSTTAPGSGHVVSDLFDGVGLDTGLWSFVDPLSDSTADVTAGRLELDLPSHPSGHGVTTGSNTLPRIEQAIGDLDFRVQAVFDSSVADGAEQGLWVSDTALDGLRVFVRGESGSTHLIAETLSGGTPTPELDVVLAGSTGAIHLELERTGDGWTVRTSNDGSAFTPRGSFAHSLAVSGIGLFAGTDPGIAHTAVVDRFLPEPGLLGSLLAGGLALGGLARRRRRR